MVIIEQKPLFYHSTVGRYVYSENSDEYSLKMAFARGRSRSFRTYTLYSLTIVCGAHINSFFRSASHHHTRTRAPYKFIASLDHPHTPVTPQQKRQPPLILVEENCCLWSAHPDAWSHFLATTNPKQITFAFLRISLRRLYGGTYRIPCMLHTTRIFSSTVWVYGVCIYMYGSDCV